MLDWCATERTKLVRLWWWSLLLVEVLKSDGSSSRIGRTQSQTQSKTDWVLTSESEMKQETMKLHKFKISSEQRTTTEHLVWSSRIALYPTYPHSFSYEFWMRLLFPKFVDYFHRYLIYKSRKILKFQNTICGEKIKLPHTLLGEAFHRFWKLNEKFFFLKDTYHHIVCGNEEENLLMSKMFKQNKRDIK